MNLIKIDQYKLVSRFSRKMFDHGGSCINEKKKASGLRSLIVLMVLVQRKNLKCL